MLSIIPSTGTMETGPSDACSKESSFGERASSTSCAIATVDPTDKTVEAISANSSGAIRCIWRMGRCFTGGSSRTYAKSTGWDSVFPMHNTQLLRKPVADGEPLEYDSI